MPSKASWLLQIPEIVAQLEVCDIPVIDRAMVERLFGLRRRRAIELMHQFGGYQAGRTFLIDRRLLIRNLQQLTEGEDFQAERQRKKRLDETLDEFRAFQSAARVKIPVRADMTQQKMAGLSPAVGLEPGHLHIEFSGAEDLLSKLYELSQAAANDFDRFRAAAEPEKAIVERAG
jgi:hypothetical protein